MGAPHEIPDGLLSDTRNFFDITWEDEHGDKKLIGILSRGMTYIGRFSPRVLTFDEGTKERELLFEYVRYARAGALDEFGKNYLSEINSFSIDEEVAAYDAQKESAV